jgi:hypothetical protein
MSARLEHPLDAELRDYLSHSDLRLMAEGKNTPSSAARTTSRPTKSLPHRPVGGAWAVLIVMGAPLYSRVPSAPLAVVVLAVLLATNVRRQAVVVVQALASLASALTRLERDVASGPRTERRAADAGLS